MRHRNKNILLFLLGVFLFLAFPKNVLAVNQFKDDFNDNSLDGWIRVDDPNTTPCSANWQEKNNRIEISINQSFCTTNLVPTDLVWGEIGSEYVIELDMTFVAGNDHNVAFRFKPSSPSNNWYDIHFISPNQLVLERVPSGTPSNVVNYYVPNRPNPYKILIYVLTGNIKVYIDGILTLDYLYNPADEKFPDGKFALRAGAGANPISVTYFDNVVVRSLERDPVILLPGFGASWNFWALLFGGTSDEWKMTPYVNIYQNLIDSLEDEGYVQDTDLWVWNYDWRKRIDDIVDDLYDFIEQSGEDKFDLVGHSMGGLVARAYAQKYGLDKVDQIITSGSPHQGSLRAFIHWDGGNATDEIDLLWLGLDLLSRVHSVTYVNSVAMVHDMVPSVQDFLPTFDYLKNFNTGDVVSPPKNTWLEDLNNNISSDVKDKLTTIVGREEVVRDSTEWYRVIPRGLADQITGRWSYGRPAGFEYTSEGDLRVLAKSASVSGALNTPVVTDTHTDMIASEDGIEEILKALGISDPDPILDTDPLPRNDSLLAVVRPDEEGGDVPDISVTGPGGEAGFGTANNIPNVVYSYEDRLIFIPQAGAGNYQVNIINNTSVVNNYYVNIGQLTDDGDEWTTIGGDVDPGNQDEVDFDFDPDEPEDILTDVDPDTLFDSAHKELLLIDSEFGSIAGSSFRAYIRRVINRVDRAELAENSSDHRRVFTYIRQAIRWTYKLAAMVPRLVDRNTITNDEGVNLINRLVLVAEYLEAAFVGYFEEKEFKTLSERRANSYIRSADRTKDRLENRINGDVGDMASLFFAAADKRLAEAKEGRDEKNWGKAYIKSYISRKLFLDVRRLL